MVRAEVCPLNQYSLLCFDNWNLTDEQCKVLNVVVKSGIEFRAYILEPIFGSWSLFVQEHFNPVPFQSPGANLASITVTLFGPQDT